VVALIPSLAITVLLVLYFYYIDPNREPIGKIIEALLLGFLIAYPASQLQGFIPSVEHYFYKSFISAGLIEEFFKLLALFIILYGSKHYNEKIDGITYGVMVALGFSVAENLLLIQDVQVGLVRAFTATPAHALYGISMGYYFSKFIHREQVRYLLPALFIPVVLHGVYNVIIMSGYIFSLLLFIPFMVYMWVLSMRKHDRYSDKV